jgi:hypothetical protein
VSDKRRFQGRSPDQSATLANPARVLRVARASLADLDDATAVLGEALVAAGLPRHAWRTELATLRLIDEALPAITVGAFLARLDAFAARGGPTWLRGRHADLEVFYQEVSALQAVARPLLSTVLRLQRTPPDKAGGRWWRWWRRLRPTSTLQQVLRHPRVEAPLAAIVEILSGFEARAPLMMAVQAVQLPPPEHKGALPHAPDLTGLAPKPFSADTWTAADVPRTGGSEETEVASPAMTLQTRAAALGAKILHARGAVPTLPVRIEGLRQRLSSPGRWSRGRRLAISAGLALAVVGGGTLLILSHQTPAAPAASAVSSLSSPTTSLTALAGSSTATAPATRAPTPAPSATALPALKLTLSCSLHGATATLTLTNAGTASFNWQVQPPPTLTAVPAQGALDAGQSAVVQVSAKKKKTATGTIQVVASHDNQTTEAHVSCQ